MAAGRLSATDSGAERLSLCRTPVWKRHRKRGVHRKAAGSGCPPTQPGTGCRNNRNRSAIRSLMPPPPSSMEPLSALTFSDCSIHSFSEVRCFWSSVLSQNTTFRNTEQRIFHFHDQTVRVFKSSLSLTANAGLDTLAPVMNNWTLFSSAFHPFRRCTGPVMLN